MEMKGQGTDLAFFGGGKAVVVGASQADLGEDVDQMRPMYFAFESVTATGRPREKAKETHPAALRTGGILGFFVGDPS